MNSYRKMMQCLYIELWQSTKARGPRTCTSSLGNVMAPLGSTSAAFGTCSSINYDRGAASNFKLEYLESLRIQKQIDRAMRVR
jgi:hypothetical protein